MAVARRRSDLRDVTLRPETDEDVPFLCALYASTRSEELAAAAWSDQEKADFLRMQFDAQRQHYRSHYPADTRYDVIECDGEPVGRWYEAGLDGERRLMDVALVPELRNRGIGTALVRELMDRAVSENERVTLHVEFFNPAMRLYENLGFRPVEQRGVYWFMEWTPPNPASSRQPVTEGRDT